MMGHAFTTPAATPRRRPRWRRPRRRQWSRPSDLVGMRAMFAAIPSLPRAELARLTEHMINRIDEIDGDPDLEHLMEDDEDGHDHEKEEAYD